MMKFLVSALFWPIAVYQAYDKSKFWWEYMFASLGLMAVGFYLGGSVAALAPSTFDIEIGRRTMIAGLFMYTIFGILAHLVNLFLGLLVSIGERMGPEAD